MTRSSSLVTRCLRYWLPVLLWMGVIFVMSSRSNLPSHPNKTVDFVAKKAGHVTEYGFLAFLLWRAIPSTGSGHRSKEKGWLALPSFRGAFVLSLLYAISDEVHQTFVPGRSGRLTDVGFDALGTLLALGLIWWFSDRRWTKVSDQRWAKVSDQRWAKVSDQAPSASVRDPSTSSGQALRRSKGAE